MIVHIDGTEVSVSEADDLGRLHVAAPGHQDPDAALRATKLGKLDGADALLHITTLKARAKAVAERSDWSDGWDAMLAYASSKGWVSTDGRFLLAHVER